MTRSYSRKYIIKYLTDNLCALVSLWPKFRLSFATKTQ